MKMDSLYGLGALLRKLPERPGRHRTENRTGHYTLDGVTRPLSQLAERGGAWTESVR